MKKQAQAKHNSPMTKLDKNNIHIDLLSDQTSCHNAYNGGYCPVGITFEERTRMLKEDREGFVKLVNETLIRHFNVIKNLTAKLQVQPSSRGN